MSKERELLEALKRSTQDDALANAASSASDIADGVAHSSGAAVSHAAQGTGFDMLSAMNFVGDFGNSFVGDPLFYLKAVAVLVVGLIILSYSVDLIFGS